MGKYNHTVDEIAKYSNQFIVISGLEIFPGKIVVLSFRRSRGQNIPQNILLVLKFTKVFIQPNRPVFRSRDLSVLPGLKTRLQVHYLPEYIPHEPSAWPEK
jgi:hypothetical protein